MQKFLLLLVMLAALAGSSIAQSKVHSGPVAIRIGGGMDIDDFSRPRIVETRPAARNGLVVISAAEAERRAFNAINQMRVQSGVRPLVWNNDLASVARLHSENMAEFRFFSHRGLDNKVVSDRAADLGSRKWRSIGENIAYTRGYQDPVERAIELWLESQAHRQNMFSGDWTESAVGVAVSPEGTYYFTQVFWVKR